MIAHLKDNNFAVTQMRNFSPGEHERITRFLKDMGVWFKGVEYIEGWNFGTMKPQLDRFDIMISDNPDEGISVYVGYYIIVWPPFKSGQTPNIMALDEDEFKQYFGIHDTTEICNYEGNNPEIIEA